MEGAENTLGVGTARKLARIAVSVTGETVMFEDAVLVLIRMRSAPITQTINDMNNTSRSILATGNEQF